MKKVLRMYPGGYTAEVTSLSPKATEEDVHDFFANFGAIEHVEIVRYGEFACTAYVTFKDAYALGTAVLLSGASILDQCVYIQPWGSYIEESDPWSSPSWKPEDDSSSRQATHMGQFVSTPGEAVTVAQEVVKTMLAKGYVLGKDAFIKAKTFDESHNVSASATAKVAELSNRIGLTDQIYAGMETFKSVDDKYHVSEISKSAAIATGTAAVVAATVTGRAAVAAGNAVVNSSYFAKGALWVSDILTRAAKIAGDFGSHDSKTME
ncbi:binding partner of ACD11 1-like isoform X1 [Juglans microcarpa x Juglans regia]|uniref:binding partner of ACD11 1-like isoform X1 n=2 Tax=Juglans microcarpa x Juglans regia TaxID=2249226 RepID=UPI001B7EDA5E|nr:binding partner of ACD11 1-like isoform X1 [Juglans microcarpa x Juglans regia]